MQRVEGQIPYETTEYGKTRISWRGVDEKEPCGTSGTSPDQTEVNQTEKITYLP